MDYVELLRDTRTVDVVDRIHGSGHARFCDYRPFVRTGQQMAKGAVPDDGLIYCLTCGMQIGSLTPPDEYTCPACGETPFMNGLCISCGYDKAKEDEP